MRIIIPMAGRGKRLRPHTLVTPKPLIPVAGKPIVQRLVKQLTEWSPEPVEEVAYVIGRFGQEVENQLLDIADKAGTKGRIYYQDEALGTAHAILCAAPSLSGKILIAFADTLFKADMQIDTGKPGIIWVNPVDDPSQFGIVELDEQGVIRSLEEKPEQTESNLAVIGIYYFRDGEDIRFRLQHLIDSGRKDKGEFQITTVMQEMMAEGIPLYTASVEAWLDCGNKNATVYTNRKILEFMQDKEQLISSGARIEDAVIIPPCYIGEGAVIERSVIGPYVSVGGGSIIRDSVITNSLILGHCQIERKILDNSMVSQHTRIAGRAEDLSAGDFTIIS